VRWNPVLKQPVLVNQQELANLSRWNGPTLDAETSKNYPLADEKDVALRESDKGGSDWLLVPEVPHVTFQNTPVTMDLIMEARKLGLKLAFIYYDAIPLRLKEYGSGAKAHETYMQELLLTDVIIPISRRSGAELTSFFIQHQNAKTRIPLICPEALPGETHLSKRVINPRRNNSSVKNILCVGSIEPRKNQLRLIESFERFSATPEGTEWKLLLAGHLRADLAESVQNAIRRNPKIQYIPHPSDSDLDNLYREATFTVFPSIEEGFGLPILESLWYGVPCICANFGAMAEVAEGGGCLTVNTYSVEEIHEAIVRLTQDSLLLKKLSDQAVMRHIADWNNYANRVSGLLTKAANPLNRLSEVYFWVDDTCLNPSNSGIQRVARQLARSLISLGVKLIPCKWNRMEKRLYPPSDSELEHFAKYSGPSASTWAKWREPTASDTKPWLLVPELVHGALGEVHKYCKAMGICTAAIFYDAIPFKLKEDFPREFSENHSQYMLEIGRYDKIFPISTFSENDFVNFLLSDRTRMHSTTHRIQKASLPLEFPEISRITSDQIHDSKEVHILSVISIEPRKNPLVLLEAFRRASKRTTKQLKLTIVGRKIPSFTDLAQKLSATIKQIPGVTWESDIDSPRLRDLYSQSAFTVFPSLEEGFGLPIAESIWHALPCITHNGGAMREIAEAGGCLMIDMNDAEQLAKAIVDLAENIELRSQLAKEALTRPATTWNSYAMEIATGLAGDRIPSTVQSSPTIECDSSVYKELSGLATRPKLSICISTYNRAKWLKVNLGILFEQILVPSAEIEILVVDNTSTDNTKEIVCPYLGRSDFRYLRNPSNVGMLGNLRITAHDAKGEYIWILGDDDLVKENGIKRVLAAICENPRVGLIYLNYSHTHVRDPNEIAELKNFLQNCPTLTPNTGDTLGTVRQVATKNENLFTAIYCLVFRRDHALRAYSQVTGGRPFSTMRTSIPTTYYVLNFMMDEPAYWIGEPILVVNFNVSWNQYAALQILERVPEAWDLAERLGAEVTGVDRWRENLFPGFCHYFKEMFQNDPLGNSSFFQPSRMVMRMKHLDAFAKIVPELREIYGRAYLAKHPVAALDPEVLFGAFDSDKEANGTAH
jgi:glycosyltransferase involved in cell wall biosynthesis